MFNNTLFKYAQSPQKKFLNPLKKRLKTCFKCEKLEKRVNFDY